MTNIFLYGKIVWQKKPSHMYFVLGIFLKLFLWWLFLLKENMLDCKLLHFLCFISMIFYLFWNKIESMTFFFKILSRFTIFSLTILIILFPFFICMFIYCYFFSKLAEYFNSRNSGTNRIITIEKVSLFWF